MNEDIISAMSRVLFYGATWGSVAAVAIGQHGFTHDERLSAAELRRLETGQSRERSRGVLRLIEQKRERQERFRSLGLTPSTATSIATAMKMPLEEPISLPVFNCAPVRGSAEPVEPCPIRTESGQYALPLGVVFQLRTEAPARRQRALQHAHAA